MSFSTDNFYHMSDVSPYSSQSAAFMARTNVLRHYKGGLYSIIGTLLDTETDEVKIYYEHLWPHRRIIASRAIPIFFGDAVSQDYDYAGPRFWFLRDDGELIQKIFHELIRPVHVHKLNELRSRQAVDDSYLHYDVPARLAENPEPPL